MNASYSQPLSRGWDRMKKALFHPFDLNKWLRVGFTAWLAGLTDCNGGSSGNNSSHNNFDWDDFFNFPQTAWAWLTEHPLWFNLIILGIVMVIIITTLLMWVCSRGKFMFLYNVANDKAEISHPWHEYRKQGNSLFIWQFFFGWFSFVVIILFLIYCFETIKSLYFADAHQIAYFWVIAGMVFMFIGIIIVFGYISLFLKDFVVPIMY